LADPSIMQKAIFRYVPSQSMPQLNPRIHPEILSAFYVSGQTDENWTKWPYIPSRIFSIFRMVKATCQKKMMYLLHLLISV
jgi:hypothetical protein